MLCERCGGDNPATNRFCHGCGAALPMACPACNHLSPPGSGFCGGCGAALGAASRPVSAPALRSVRGELKQVTVLFADLVSSTEIVAGLTAEDAMQRLKPALDAMCTAVERFEGTVVRTLGDGILAFFGAPRAQEGHALLACEAALAIRDTFRLRDDGMSVRVGLHSGEIVADAPLVDTVTEHGAYGLTIHLASRLPAKADPNEICLTDETYRLVRSFCEVGPLGRHRLRGVPEPIELYLLKDLKPAVASQQFRGVSLATFRGREREMTVLQRTLAAVETGGSCVTGIVGPPGTGKSRLCYEFAEWCRARLIPVLEARAQPYGAATPLQPVLEFLRSTYFNVSPDDEPDLAVKQIATRLAELGSTFEADLWLVCDFLGVRHGQGPPSWLSPRARNVRLLDIVRHMVRQRGASASVIIIEDLHWLDQASEEFVATLVDAVISTKTVLIVNFRPAYFAPWMRGPQYQQIELAELSPTDTDDLVDELLGPRDELLDVRRRVAERSGGNPFFAEELIRSLVEHLVIVGEQGSYRRGLAGAADVLPPTVQAVIGARIDRLAPGDRDLLHTAAIIGKEFQLAVLQSVASLPAGELEAALVRLCSGEMLQARGGKDGQDYSFRHPLIQEIAYSTQLRARRSLLHARVARAIVQYFPERLDEFAALLSHHFEQAGELDAAAEFAARAARWIGSTNPAEAIRHWHKVRALKGGQKRSPAGDALRIAASSQIAWLGWREGMTSEDAKPFIQEALEWARDIDDSMIPLLLFVEGRIAGASGGQADAYVDTVKEALALTEARQLTSRTATLNASLSQAYGWAGLLREALAASDAALAGASGITDFEHQFLGYNVEHWILSLRGRILVRLGRFDEARLCLDRILAIDPTLIDPTVQFIANLGYVDLAWCLDDSAMASTHAWRVIELATRQASPYLRAYSLACIGTAQGIAQNYQAAIPSLTEGVEFVRSARVAMEIEPEMLASIADYQLCAGAHAAAVDKAREAIRVAQERHARLPECRATITLAAALAASNEPEHLGEVARLVEHAERLFNLTGAAIYGGLLEQVRRRLSVGA
ncbi:AAA family ATPase [Bradyrhizobium japonicum]|uniref:ATP-binding protein n=1 Tax=Bradyrhizobium japonicum TaxID=375 RepID=UPI001BA84BDE|nr:adenylate/guanylate cyclase domain-containing protein [Bradyrhizobium japonicum]MBR0989759.1 AAA family ATPase [Bradyrhizobium japonicum]